MINTLDFKTGLLKQIASAAGLDATTTREQVKAAVRARMEPAIPHIARKIERHGWLLLGQGETAMIRDILTRLWREVFYLQSGILVVDLIRDCHHEQVFADLAVEVTPEKTLAEIVRRTMDTTLELVF